LTFLSVYSVTRFGLLVFGRSLCLFLVTFFVTSDVFSS
jgi:hypothetical protein